MFKILVKIQKINRNLIIHLNTYNTFVKGETPFLKNAFKNLFVLSCIEQIKTEMSEFIRGTYSHGPIRDFLTSKPTAENEVDLPKKRYGVPFSNNLLSSALPVDSVDDSTISNYLGAAPRNPLTIVRIDPLLNENGKNHRTTHYDHMKTGHTLVIRRSQAFKLKLSMDRSYSPQNDGISLVFKLAGLFMLNNTVTCSNVY